jgi:hypothetical protein
VHRPAPPGLVPVLGAALHRNGPLFGVAGRGVAESHRKRFPAAASPASAAPSEILWRRTFDEDTTRLKDRAVFTLGKISYDLPCTGPDVPGPPAALREGGHTAAEPGIPADARILLTRSLREPYRGVGYRAAAARVRSKLKVA